MEFRFFKAIYSLSASAGYLAAALMIRVILWSFVDSPLLNRV